MLILAEIIFPLIASARFELIQEWAVNGLGYAYFFAPSGPYVDGNMYWYDRAGATEFPLWRVQGTTMEPVTGFDLDAEEFDLRLIFNVGNMVVMTGTLNGVQTHFRIDGNAVIPLESEFGPVPFDSEYLWTPMEFGTLISARDVEHGREFWVMDEDGYTFTQDLYKGFESSHPTSAGDWLYVPLYDWYQRETIADSKMLLRMDDGISGPEPWMYDRSTNSFQILADLVPGPGGSYPRWLGKLGDNHYFATLDQQIFKTDRVNIQSIENNYQPSNTSPNFKAEFEFEENLYVWRIDVVGDGGHVLRITGNDTVTQFIPATPSMPDNIRIESVFPHNGEVHILGKGRLEGANMLKIMGDDIVHSSVFPETVIDPEISAYTESEMLYWEIAATVFQFDVYCMSNGESVPAWRKPDNFHFKIANYFESADWVYVVAYDILGYDGLPGGRVQLWGMRWPQGCQQPWVEDMILDTGFE